jgi:anti-anti-sigma factor
VPGLEFCVHSRSNPTAENDLNLSISSFLFDVLVVATETHSVAADSNELAKAERTMEHGTRVSVLEVEGTLRAPMNRELGHRVETLLCRGERRVVLDLVRLTDIDAAGVGELVSAFNMTNAAGGILRIARASRRVRRLLDVTGVLSLLSPDSETRLERTVAQAATVSVHARPAGCHSSFLQALAVPLAK